MTTLLATYRNIMKQHLHLLAAYHAWTFEILYAALRPLDDTR